MFNRSERRHHIERLKEARKRYWSRPSPMTDKDLGSVVQHPQACSCPGCGNPRRHFGNSAVSLTIQEQSMLEAVRKYEFEPEYD